MAALIDDQLRDARARIAEAWGLEGERVAIGSVMLRDAQREAAARVRRMIDVHRGCLLADDVGRGKTFVSLAIARRWSRPLVVIPAALRDTWQLAMKRAGVTASTITHEALSRGGRPAFEPDGVIVDESHHFRNPHARRHAVLADVASRAEILLLSATPVQNSTADLAVQLSLFLGAAVSGLDERQLGRFVVRVDSDDADTGLPVLAAPAWVPVAADDSDVLDAILDLPSPPRALDAGDAGALRTVALVRAWASSRAALLSTIARRRRMALGVEQSLEAGRVPTRRELHSWNGGGEDAFQLGFAELLVAPCASGLEASQREGLRLAVREEHRALARLAALLRARQSVDRARADALFALVRKHDGARVLAFSGFASTARAYHALLRGVPGVALLTAAEATIASGRISRRELMVRFAPSAHGCPEPPGRERITLLIATDLLSEGVNLQDASVVVHLDLPWNPARLAQRVGRVRRPHGAALVSAYLIAPPAGTEHLLAVESRLRRKLADVERTIGRTVDVVPALATMDPRVPSPATRSGASVRAALHRRLRGWTRASVAEGNRGRPVVAAACGQQQGWLALLGAGRLVAALDGVVGDDVSLTEPASSAVEGAARPARCVEVHEARVALRQFLERERVLADCGVRDLVTPIARAVLQQASMRVACAARDRRMQCAGVMTQLRCILERPCSLGTERAVSAWLADDARAPADPLEWLRALRARLPACGSRSGLSVDAAGDVAVLILFGPPEEGHDGQASSPCVARGSTCELSAPLIRSRAAVLAPLP